MTAITACSSGWVRSAVAVWMILSGSRPQAGTPARREYPLYCAGIVVGMSTDRDVRRMYGDGLFVRNEGHLGGRYYVDAKQQVTLHVEIGVDHGIDSVTYSRGLRLPAEHRKGSAVPKRAISSRLTPGEHLRLGLKLGDPANEVLKQYGKPKSDTRRGTARAIRYETDYETTPYVLYYEAEFRFVRDRLVSVRLHNGE